MRKTSRQNNKDKKKGAHTKKELPRELRKEGMVRTIVTKRKKDI